MMRRFTEQQHALLRKIGVRTDVEADLTDEQWLEVEDSVSEHLIIHCFDAEYNPNEEGRICEDILGRLSMM